MSNRSQVAAHVKALPFSGIRKYFDIVASRKDVISLGVGVREGLMLGLVPFLIGDAIKAVLASAVLPAAWKLVGGAPR